jgi:hypothetical protein
MIKFFKAALLLCIVSCISFEAAAQQNYWSQYNDATALVPDKAVKRKSFPGTYKLFDLNIIAFRQQLFSIVDDQHSIPLSLLYQMYKE